MERIFTTSVVRLILVLLVCLPPVHAASISNTYEDPHISPLPRHANATDPTTFHLFSHGRPGQLFLNGKWLNAQEIALFLKSKTSASRFDHLNIYGCEFAKGEAGLQAVKVIEAQLGMAVSASDDVTGKDGDWELEVGVPNDALSFPFYMDNLQGPGGVSTGLYLWTKANAGVVTSGSNVSQWTNQASTSMTTQASKTASSHVTLDNNSFNYNPTLVFDGTSAECLTGAFSTAGTNPSLLFVVVKKSTTPNVNAAGPYCVGTTTTGTSGFISSGIRYNNNGSFGIDYTGGQCAQTIDTRNIPGIVRADYNSTTTTSGATSAFNGLVNVTACGANSLQPANTIFQIGGRALSTDGGSFAQPTLIYSGQLAEVIHFNSNTPGATEINKIESYLAVKYGITLSNSLSGSDGDYTSSGGSLIWDASNGSSYHNNIIGIGRDDNSALMQKQSHQADDNTRICINTLQTANTSNSGTFSSDGQFVLMGSNGGSLSNTGSTEYPSGISARINREWKITNTNFNGSFSIDVKLESNCSFNASSLRLLVDDDGEFGTGASAYSGASGLTFSFNSGVITVNGISTAMIPSGSTKFITLATALTGGTPASAQTICSGSSPVDLTLSGNTGSVTKWQYSSDNFVSDIHDIALSGSSTLSSALMGTLTTNRYYRAVVESVLCETANSSSVLVTVNASTVPGTVSSAQTICSGSSPADLTLAGNTGSVVKWQYATDAGFTTGVTDISNTTTTLSSATMGILTTDRYYRAVVQNGACAAANTAAVKITVNAPTVAGTVSSAQTICSGSSPADLTLAGNTGSVVKWQYATDAGFTTEVTDISNTTTTLTAATMGALTADRYYRAVVQSGVCAAANTAAVKITVNATTVAGTVSSAQTICSGDSPTGLTLSGNTGSVVKWQYATDAGFTTGLTDISNTITTLSSATMGALTADRYYRAVVQNGVCAAANTAAVKITVDAPTVAGTVSSAQTICSGSSPANLTLSGNTGSVVKWQYSTASDFSDPQDVANTTTTLDAATMGNLTADRYYRAVVQNGTCAAANTPIVKITVDAPTVAGTVTSAQTICSGSSPADLTLAGNTGSVVKWQYATDAGFTTGVTDISNTTTTLSSATMGALTADRYYRAVVQNGACAAANTAAVRITVNATTVPGIVSSTQTICSGSSPADLTLSGQTGSVVKWQYATDAGFTTGVTDISNTTTTLSSATMGALTADRYYRAVVQNGVCAAANTAAVKITVDAPTVAGTVFSAQTICSGSSPTDLTLSGNTGSVVKWQYSTASDFSDPQDIANTTTTLTPGNLTADRYYRAVVQNGTCAAANTPIVKITVNATTVAGTVSSAQTICSGDSPTDLTLSGNTGSVVKWQYSLASDFSDPQDIANATATLTPGILIADRYYRAVVQNGTCAAANTPIIKITVDAPTVAGTVSSAQTICSGSSPTDLTLSGNSGSVVKWQYSLGSDFSDPQDIANTTARLDAATMGNLTADRYYRAVVQNGTCAAANTPIVKITVDAPTVAGTVSSAQTICSGSSPADLTLAGNTGSVVKWQYATDTGFTTGVTDISNTATTLSSATMGALTADRYYRAVVQNGTCAVANTPIVKITVNATTVAGTISQAQTICSGDSPTDLTLSGNSGDVVKWQYSLASDFSDPQDIANSTATLTPGNLTADRYYRAVVKNRACDEATTEVVKITVNACPETCPLQIRGIVLNDTDGAGNGVNGTPINGLTVGLYMTLVTAGEIKQVVQVRADGSYRFDLLNPGTYSLVLSNNPEGAVVSTLPSNIMVVAEGGSINSTTGHSMGDGTPDGATEVILACPQSVTSPNIDFGLTGPPLPVTLISFKAQAGPEGNKLTWRTSDEVDFDRFEIEYSAKPQSGFGRIGEQKGGMSDYLYVDEVFRKGISYYRLKMIDLDGSYAYSRVVTALDQRGLKRDELYPSPTNGAHIRLICHGNLESYRITDLSGREVPVQISGANGRYEFKFDRDVLAGLYVITYKIDGRQFSRQFVIAY